MTKLYFSKLEKTYLCKDYFEFLMSQFLLLSCCGPSESASIYTFKASGICACIQTTSHSAKFTVKFSLKPILNAEPGKMHDLLSDSLLSHVSHCTISRTSFEIVGNILPSSGTLKIPKSVFFLLFLLSPTLYKVFPISCSTEDSTTRSFFSNLNLAELQKQPQKFGGSGVP
jgi:hypothetical protein